MTRPPILFVHGIRTSSSMWRGQVDAARSAGLVAAAVDLPGHGSRIGGAFSIDAAVDAIDEAVDSLGGRVVLVGLSLGGYIGITYAARRPEKVALLVASSCFTLPRGVGLAGYRVLARVIHRLPDRGRWLNDTMARLAVGSTAAEDIGSGGVALDVMDETLAAIGGTRPIADLARYPGPVWFVTGALDHFRLDERSFRRARPEAPVIVVPRASHLVSLVAPAAFARIVRDAVAAAPDRPSGSEDETD
ncbi:alpha/beta hydrolase [Labedella populi]|uniref:Alpha/beta hydrolase n=1 Tax=Labedella populi TaxID=2498850 RepID=A0A3S4AJ61_9MICO|nr:alpha/beta hydrolase [Labedella populi]RWZ61249.1 alpha/beta hydrolase [Labedella populi]